MSQQKPTLLGSNVIDILDVVNGNIRKRQQITKRLYQQAARLPVHELPIAFMYVELYGDGKLTTGYYGVQPEYIEPMLGAKDQLAQELRRA